MCTWFNISYHYCKMKVLYVYFAVAALLYFFLSKFNVHKLMRFLFLAFVNMTFGLSHPFLFNWMSQRWHKHFAWTVEYIENCSTQQLNDRTITCMTEWLIYLVHSVVLILSHSNVCNICIWVELWLCCLLVCLDHFSIASPCVSKRVWCVSCHRFGMTCVYQRVATFQFNV